MTVLIETEPRGEFRVSTDDHDLKRESPESMPRNLNDLKRWIERAHNAAFRDVHPREIGGPLAAVACAIHQTGYGGRFRLPAVIKNAALLRLRDAGFLIVRCEERRSIKNSFAESQCAGILLPEFVHFDGEVAAVAIQFEKEETK